MLKALLVEDDEDSIELVRSAVSMAKIPVEIFSVLDGIEALNYLTGPNTTSHGQPDLILLDLNLPRKNGRQLLAEMVTYPSLQKIPIVLLSTTEWHDDIRNLYPTLEAQCFGKPMRFQEYIDLLTTIYTRCINKELRGLKA